MQTYIVKRLLLFIPTLLLVTLLVFLLMRVVPGDPALYMLVGDNVSGQVTQAQIDAKRAELGTDRPIMVQYVDWIWGMARGNFGISMFFDDPISDTLAVRFPVTLELTAMAQLIAMLVAVPLGVFSAVKQDALGDYAARIVTMTGVAIPTFYTAILTIYFLVLLFEWAPPLNYAQLWEDPWLNLQQLVFPALALGFYNMAITARMTRSAMLEVFREDYIRTARSKGLREGLVIMRHALKNAFLPVLTVFGWQLARLMAGAVLIEEIFLVPGMGRTLVDSIEHRDYTMIQALIMVVAVMIMLTNLVVDIIYAWLDPRIRYA